MKKVITFLVLVLLLAATATTVFAAEQQPPNVKLTFICKAPEDGFASAYVGAGIYEPVPVSAGDYIFRVKNYGDVDISGWEVFKAGNSITTGGAIAVGGHDFFTLDYSIAGLHVITDPYSRHGNSSTNESECEMVEQPKEPTCQALDLYEYTLEGNFPCLLATTSEYGGSLKSIPDRFVGTTYVKNQCSSDCNGNPVGDWKYSGSWSVNQLTTCDLPCSDCYSWFFEYNLPQ